MGTNTVDHIMRTSISSGRMYKCTTSLPEGQKARKPENGKPISCVTLRLCPRSHGFNRHESVYLSAQVKSPVLLCPLPGLRLSLSGSIWGHMYAPLVKLWIEALRCGQGHAHGIGSWNAHRKIAEVRPCDHAPRRKFHGLMNTW